ncbi:hypothetical protein SLS63_003381 [Diaporthe eres]|uniref:Myb-like domain-containing protein n=1 Tax=Diaporthe eres TaxID=83184 RepID=A0ABR1PGR8_DIAER
MRSLLDYDSDGHPERGDATLDPQDETPGQTQVLPDVDTIIQKTKADIQQARLKADTLICRYFKEFIAAAGQLRDGAIQRYRERLEELPAKDRAKVCETLAKDEDVCSNMEFGDSIKAKWLSMRTRDIWHEWEGTRGQTQVDDAKGKDLMEDPDLETHDENDSGSFMEYDEDESSDNEGRQVSNGLKKWKKRNMVPVLAKSALQEEVQTPASSSRLPHSERPGQSEVAVASESRRKIRPAKEHRTQLWSPREIEILTKLTKGFNKWEDIDFKYIAAQLPDPSRRSAKACKSFWVRRVEPSLSSKDKDPTHGDEAPGKVPDSSRKLGPHNPPTKANKRGPEANSDSGSRKLSKKARSTSQSNLLDRSKTVEDTW